jgi:hypothetical protein
VTSSLIKATPITNAAQTTTKEKIRIGTFSLRPAGLLKLSPVEVFAAGPIAA